MTKPCIECGVSFKRGEFESGAVFRKRIYCSNACVQKYLNRKHAEMLKRKAKTP